MDVLSMARGDVVPTSNAFKHSLNCSVFSQEYADKLAKKSSEWIMKGNESKK